MGDPILPFHQFLFTYEDMVYRQFTVDDRFKKQVSAGYSLLSVSDGEGVVAIDGKRFRLAKGVCCLISPGSVFGLESAGKGPLGVYCLTFLAKRAVSESKQSDDPADQAASGRESNPRPAQFRQESGPLPFSGKLDVQPAQQWTESLSALYEERDASDGLMPFKRHIRLQQLLYYLCERNLPQSNRTPVGAVNRTIDELHADPSQPASVASLAEKANMGARQYANVFKELTGTSPLDYITELRINRAKEHLLITGDSHDLVARRVGFQDVYYFSRRFKQLVGMSPLHYVHKRRRELRVVALYYGGILMSMGVKPVGANLTWWGGSAHLKEAEAGVVDVGVRPTAEEIVRLAPDLILMNSNNMADYEQLSKLAPAVLIPYDGNRSVFEETKLVGELVGHTRAAGIFLNRYEVKAADCRAKLADAGVAPAELTAAIVRFEGGGSLFSVFGDNYGRGGWAVYRGLRFRAPERVQNLIDNGEQIAQRLPLSRLPDYVNGVDVVFVVNEGEGTDRVADNEIWQNIPAVKRNRYWELSREQFSYCDPVSLEAQLELLTVILLERGV